MSYCGTELQSAAQRRGDGADIPTEALLEREQELVAGWAGVAATSEDELEEHAQVIEQLVHESGMDLRVLDGRQDLAWAAALPLGLAPRSLLAG